MQSLHSFIPKKSISKIQSWIDELGVVVELKGPRKSKLGDFKAEGSSGAEVSTSAICTVKGSLVKIN